MSRTDAILADLAAEHDALDERVAALDDERWTTPTPAEGWAVRDQISHLNYFDDKAKLALTDPDAFRAHVEDLFSGRTPVGDTDLGRTGRHDELLEAWRRDRRALVDAATKADPDARVPWYGPAMSLASFLTARLMETWAHGQDVADALDLPPVVSERLRHVCHIGVGARAYTHRVHGVEDTGEPVRVTLRSPSGETWSWGPEDAANVIEGSALEFALVATQRRHRDDTSLRANGPVAEQWLSILQAFAGPAGTGREPGMPIVEAAS
ncbi:MAG TPA: TIGR03084 family metal-binding protein [Acidimicrobiales bacterium]